MALPTWAPTLEHVADHIPTRTRPREPAGSTEFLGTFTALTEPANDQAMRHIAAAVAEVLSAVGAVPDTPGHLAELACEAAALRAAADIELAYPNRDADVNVFTQLDQRAKDTLQRLVDACNDAGGGPDALLPVYAFPDPPTYGDYPL